MSSGCRWGKRSSAVFLWSDRALFLGDRSATASHAHNAIELCIALDELGVSYETDHTVLTAAAGAAVRPDTTHRLTIPGPKVAVLYLEPGTPLGAGLSEWLGDAELRGLPSELVSRVRPGLLGLFRRECGLQDADRSCRGLLTSLVPDPPQPVLDQRVRRAMELLSGALRGPPTQEEVAAEVGLSAGRLGHLFSEQVGVPMRRWILWMRLRAALTEALAGASMTEAAHRAGFSDASHFSRTCRSMFGLAPSTFAPVEDLFVGP